MTPSADTASALRIGIVGYGEVGTILAEDLREQGCSVAAFDIKLDVEGDAGQAMRVHAARTSVTLVRSHVELAARSELVISAVTASQAVPVAHACAPGVLPGSFFLDFNSASPGAKIEAAQQIERAGGRYVEGAVMATVPPHRIRVPLLLGGPHASALAPSLSALGFSASVASEEFGVASATKLCRSVIVKGMEAIVIEALCTARHYGVEEQVLASLEETFLPIDWRSQAAYFFQRVIQHGRRRAEEMREAAQTVREAGLTPDSASATAAREAFVASLSEAGLFGDDAAARSDWRAHADRILSARVPRGECT